MRRLSRISGALVATSLFAVGGASFAASEPLTDEVLAPLTSAYMRAVKPGEQAELHRELFQTVLQRVQRTYAREVDMPGLVAAALKTIEPLEPQSGEPVDVFKKSINAALASLDPHSRYLDPEAQAKERSAITGSFGGLGLQVDMVEGLMRVSPRCPARRRRAPACRAATSSCGSTTSPCWAWRSRTRFPGCAASPAHR